MLRGEHPKRKGWWDVEDHALPLVGQVDGNFDMAASTFDTYPYSSSYRHTPGDEALSIRNLMIRKTGA